MSDVKFVDDYLTKWDRFARGENALVPYLRENRLDFEAALTHLLQAGDKGAPARLVFYPVVQVGGYIDLETELGKAALALVGEDVPITTTEDGKSVLFAGHLYFWWQQNHAKYESLTVFDEWCAGEFAQETVLPMYRSMCEQQ